MGRILHPWKQPLPDVAQTLCLYLRGSPQCVTSPEACSNLSTQQLLQQHAIEIAKTYTVNQDRWTKAAQDMRTPYWDWAVNAVPPPEVSLLDQVTITKPDGSKGKVPNPLVKYTFHPIDSSFPSPYSDWQTTLRHPRPSSGPNAKSDVKAMERYALTHTVDFIVPDVLA